MALFDYLLQSNTHASVRQVAAARLLGEVSLANDAALAAKVREQREDIRDLTVLVSVLIKMLGEAGHLDEKTLRYRVEAELEALAESNKPGEDIVTCIKCRQSFKSMYTSMTEDGVVCDRCMATG